ncbi:FusB/FusC family EF-G-binding protein [Paenilisteria rocourtiae]|uniref:Fibronectin-binding protein (FBP) n=1 Tax=Listeria rocourtiae TaxID=647910 RepID=A0A4R6ZPC1_9LIST|nr:FusB/FusC family EF-G-binding protein [Listeria rocourtiae]MBC1434069.1 FusB/FusC family EF-G-binding protein [Listeria rocourtiae]MBC1603593.1 FusB/FusC family EF-G-binding protein [Listeria rocourtiae]TDR53949.1 fibronectin-binding protein (FBP) [Listeria rocourtiae]
MNAFITNANYHFILKQATNAFYGAQNTNDEGVKNALRFSCIDKAQAIFEELEVEQGQLIGKIFHIHSEEELEAFGAKLQEFLIPFPLVTDATIKKLFPKVKKLKLPTLSDEEIKQLVFLGWNDTSAQKKFIIAKHDGKLTGIQGNFTPTSKKGICAFCHQNERVGLFKADIKTKGSTDNFRAIGQYICADSLTCSSNVQSTNRLDAFIHELKS